MKKPIIIAALMLIIAFISLRFALPGVERWMRQEPHRMPPAWQIRHQTIQLAQPMIPDDDVGIMLPGNLAKAVVTDDFTFTRRSDARGFPNASPWPNHADIVFLGDSLLLGEGVGVENSFVARIDAMLADETVLNLGNGGAGAERQFRIYRRFGAPLQPRLVVAGLYLAADLENDRHFLDWVSDSKGMDYESFRLSYRRRMEQPSQSDTSRRIERHPLLAWAQSLIESHLWGTWRMPHRVTTAKAEYFLERRKFEFARRPAADAAVEIEALFSSLDRLRRLVEVEGQARLAVMLIPSKEELFAALPRDDGILEAVRAWLSAERIPYLDLYPILREREAGAATYFPRDIHLSRFGNEVVAKAFVDWRRTVQAEHP